MSVTLTAKLTNLWPSFPDRIGIWSVGAVHYEVQGEGHSLVYDHSNESYCASAPVHLVGAGSNSEVRE